MKNETREYIHNEAMSLIRDAMELLEPRTDEYADTWYEQAVDLLSYVEQHYKED